MMIPPPPLRELFLQHNAQTTASPLLLEFVRAEGIYLYDQEGKAYTDLISGIGVSNLGHSHPKVIAAVQQQAAKYMHLMVYGEYLQAPQVLFAQLLCAQLPESLQSVYFVNSGSEAVEGSMKLAKRATGRAEIIACANSYHGSTQGALSIMGSETYKCAFRPLLPGVKFMEYNNLPDLAQITNQTAAVVIEAVQGEAGVIVPSESYMKALRNRCDATGALLILDEIQTGMGRTGKLFAYQHFDIVPDILLLAKALGAGMPLGAFVASQHLMSCLKQNPILGHITTFGGHPVSCAAGLAGLELLLDNDDDKGLITTVASKHLLFKKLLLEDKNPAIKEFRGLGLLMCIELESFAFNKQVIDLCIAKGVITDWFLHNGQCMRLAPPLIISEEEIAASCKVILEALGAVANQ